MSRNIPFYVIGIDPGNHYGFFIAQVWFSIPAESEELLLKDISNINVYFWFSCTVNTVQKVLSKWIEEFRKLDEKLKQKNERLTWLIFIEDQFISFKRSSLKLSWNAGYIYGLLEGLLLPYQEIRYKGPYKVFPSSWYNLFMQPDPEEYYKDTFLKTYRMRFDELVKVGYSYPRESQHAFEAFLIALAGIIRYHGKPRRKKKKKSLNKKS